jgi:D-alanyl-D-alanine carboxypeptidase (penicillin-binding protein 5/6)
VIGAAAAIVLQGDADSVVSGNERVLYAHNPYERRPIASTTKMMTAYVAITHASAGRVLTVQPYVASPGETVAGLVPGQRLTVRDLLKAMLLPSGGDAAHTLAVDLAGSTSRFVGWMNAAAVRLRLRHTHYSTPVGLDTPGNYASAGDLARLALVLLRNQTVADIVDEHSARLTDGQVVINHNDLVGRYPFVVGVKTGHTNDAGYCLVGAARRGDAVVVSVVLGDSSEGTRDADTLTLLRYGLGHLRPVSPLPPSQLSVQRSTAWRKRPSGDVAAPSNAGMIPS